MKSVVGLDAGTARSTRIDDLTLDASNVEPDGRLDSSDLTVDLDASNVELDGRLDCRSRHGNFDELESADPYVIVLTF